jgi:hypothetical protein
VGLWCSMRQTDRDILRCYCVTSAPCCGLVPCRLDYGTHGAVSAGHLTSFCLNVPPSATPFRLLLSRDVYFDQEEEAQVLRHQLQEWAVHHVTVELF